VRFVKTLVVASGKGGTGKTTITALFARLASPGSAVLADCDVEASNLPLALTAKIDRKTGFEGAARASIDAAKCVGCGRCEEACRIGAIRARSQYGRRRVDQWMCEGCGVCERVCPAGAVASSPSKAGEIFEGRTSVGEIAFARLAPGEDLSGKLVTQVRARAQAIGSRLGARLLLIDGPPGVGCPLIASMSNAHGVIAVAEPSRSGVHDLLRLVELARHLGVPLRVVLNKADLSESGRKALLEACGDEDLEVLGEVPFDSRMATVPASTSGKELAERLLPDGSRPGIQAVSEVWRRVEAWAGR